MNNNEEIQSAVNDLAIIRRAIEKAHSASSAPSNQYAIDGGLLFQGLCLLISCGLIAFELTSGRSMTAIMMLSEHEREIGILGLIQVAITVPTLVMCIYFIAWRAARHSDQNFQDYIARNFQYLRNLSLVSDLVVKLIPLSLLILGGHPEWISAILSLYIADYLIQGRFFTLPLKIALTLGIISILVAAAQYLTGSTQLVWPLLHFSCATLISIAHLFRLRGKSAIHLAEENQ